MRPPAPHVSPTGAHPAFPDRCPPGPPGARRRRIAMPRVPPAAGAPGLAGTADLPPAAEPGAAHTAPAPASMGSGGRSGAHTPLRSPPKSPNKGSAPSPCRELKAFNQPSASRACTSCCYSPAPPRALPPGKPSPRRTRLAGAPLAHLPSQRGLLRRPRAGWWGPGPAQQHIEGAFRACRALAGRAVGAEVWPRPRGRIGAALLYFPPLPSQLGKTARQLPTMSCVSSGFGRS